MQKKLTWTDFLAFIVWLLPLIYLTYVYPSLPDTVPLHFDGDGNPDLVTANKFTARSTKGMQLGKKSKTSDPVSSLLDTGIPRNF